MRRHKGATGNTFYKSWLTWARYQDASARFSKVLEFSEGSVGREISMWQPGGALLG